MDDLIIERLDLVLASNIDSRRIYLSKTYTDFVFIQENKNLRARYEVKINNEKHYSESVFNYEFINSIDETLIPLFIDKIKEKAFDEYIKTTSKKQIL